MNIINEGDAGKIFLNFLNLASQNEKMDGKSTGLPQQNITLAPHEINNILTPSTLSHLLLSGGAHMCVLDFVINGFDFLANSYFIIGSSKILMDYLMFKLSLSLKMKMVL